MKLPSHLAKSRHGIFYFRLTFSAGSSVREKRLSLRTKDPQEARIKATYLSGIMAVRKQEHRREMAKDLLEEVEKQSKRGTELMMNLLQKCDRQQLAELSGLSLSQVDALFPAPTPAPASGIRKLDFEMTPGGYKLSNINSDEDMHRALQILQSLPVESMAKLLAGPNPTAITPSPQPPAQITEEGGTTIQELVPRFAARRSNGLTVKTLYEYGNYHRKFVAWLEHRKQQKHIPVHSVTRADVSDFIDDLLNQGLKPKTIKEKYLAAISGLFELARTLGSTGALGALVSLLSETPA